MRNEDENYALGREAIKLAKKKNPQAIKIFTDLLMKEKDSVAKASYYWHRGNAYYGLRLYQNAVEDYTLALKIRASRKPPLAAVFHSRGNAYLMLSDYQNAIKDYTREIELNKTFDEAYLNRAEAHVRLGMFKQAKHDLEKALEVTKRPNFIYKNLPDLKPPTKRGPNWRGWLKLHKGRAVLGTIFAIVGSGCLLFYAQSTGFLNFLNALLIVGVIMIITALAAFELIHGISLPYMDIGLSPKPLSPKDVLIESDQDILWPSY